MRTTNKGEVWDTLSLGWDVQSIAVNSLGHLFLATAWGGGFLRSTNDGDNWMSINSGISSFGLTIFSHPSGDLYASSLGGGAYRSTNAGDSWSQMNTGLAANSIFCFSLNNSGHLLAGTWGNGVFRSSQTTLVSAPIEPPVMPSTVQIDQNYPNPFNPNTTIRFSLPTAAMVYLKVYDSLGREVATLHSGHLPSGPHALIWNANGLASGVYFYRLETANNSITRKAILIE